jgi:hypothetical protein
MNQIQFRQFVFDLSDYYERKRPQDSTLDLWFNEVHAIPEEPLEWMKVKIFKENDSKPSNIPATMWALYNAWLQANPHKRSFREEVNCPDCESGWLALEKEVDGYRQKISHSAACGKCKQIPSAHYMTLQEAISEDYNRKDLKTYPVNSDRNLKTLLDKIGTKIPSAPKVIWD